MLRRTDPTTGGAALDHVVVELSGVADPSAVQARLMAAGILVDRTVALVDAQALPWLFASTDALSQRPELIDPSVLSQVATGQVVCELDEQVVELTLTLILTLTLTLTLTLPLTLPLPLSRWWSSFSNRSRAPS